MGFKATLKTFGAILWKNRAKIESIVGGALVVGGTAYIISKARDAADISYTLEETHDLIKRYDAQDKWESKKERNHEVRTMVGFAVKEYTKCYGIGLAMEAVGLTLIGISDVTMSKEIATAWTAATGYAEALKNYRQRVIADVGEEKDHEYMFGPQATTVDILPDGTVVQTTVPVENNNRAANLPPNCYIFDQSNPNWEPEASKNRDFLEDHLRWLNKRLEYGEDLFTNDILRDLNMPLVKSGWTSGILAYHIDENGNKVRNYLSFGLDKNTQAAQRFRDGLEPTVILELNVEPNIIDKMNLALI